MTTKYYVRYDIDDYNLKPIKSTLLYHGSDYNEAKRHIDEKVEELKKQAGDVFSFANHINDYYEENVHLFDDSVDCVHELTLTTRMCYKDGAVCDMDGLEYEIK